MRKKTATKAAKKTTSSRKAPRKAKPASAPVKKKAAPSSRKGATAGQALTAFVRATKDFVSGETIAYITVPRETLRVEVSWYVNNPPDGAGISGKGTDNVKYNLLESQTIDALMLEAARRWPGKANPLQITCQAKGARGKEQQRLLELARAAWCEVLGQETPSQADLDGAEASKQARLLALLRGGKAGIAKWNRKHGSHEKPNPTWDVKDFSGVDLAGVALAGVCLARLNWAKCNLSRADLSNAECFCIDWRGANLADANLTSVGLVNSRCERADFSRANLAGAWLGFGNYRKAKFVDADLRGADLMTSDLIGADLTGARLDKARLAGTKFDETTRWPAGYTIPPNATWRGKGPDPRTHVEKSARRSLSV